MPMNKHVLVVELKYMWVPMSEATPPVLDERYIYATQDEVDAGWWMIGEDGKPSFRNHFKVIRGVTHWMPKPPNPNDATLDTPTT